MALHIAAVVPRTLLEVRGVWHPSQVCLLTLFWLFQCQTSGNSFFSSAHDVFVVGSRIRRALSTPGSNINARLAISPGSPNPLGA